MIAGNKSFSPLLSIVIGGSLFWLSGSAQAAVSEATTSQPIRKLSRGLANAVAGVLEIPLGVSVVSEKEGPVAGLSLGLLLGFGAAVTRIGVGVIETATFPFPLPSLGYEPILTPEFLLQPGSSVLAAKSY